jgi:signal transduction histidine kinase
MKNTMFMKDLTSKRTRLYGAVLLVLWIILFFSTIMSSITFFNSVQLSYLELKTEGTEFPTLYAGLYVFFDVIRFMGFLVVGLFLVFKKPNEIFPLMASLIFITAAPIFSDGPELTSSALQWMETATFYIGWILLMPFFYLYPSGRFIPKWTIVLTPIWIIISTGMILFPGGFLDPLTWPVWLDKPAILIFHASAIYSQIYRYKNTSDTVERLQTKWFVYGVVITLIMIPLAGLIEYISDGQFAVVLVGTIIRSICPLLIPVSIVIAILKYNLWNIHVIINRSIVYGLLTTIVVTTYVLGVYGSSLLIKVDNSIVLSLIMTGVIAVVFQPLRENLQRRVNRFMYGEVESPYEVISKLGQRLEGSFKEDDALQTIAQTMKEALKLPYVAISLLQGKQQVAVFSEGDPVKDVWNIPLVYQGEELGILHIAPRYPGESFSRKDEQLIKNLARHAGITAYNVRLLIDLQRSRTALVTAREEERKRLSRDLHDGLGPTLAALNLQTMLLKKIIKKDGESAINFTNEIQTEIQKTIEDVRRIVYDLRPPVLEELGFIGSIRAYSEQISYFSEGTSLQINVHTSEEYPNLPAAIEIALYRITKEALTNVIHHSRANVCNVTFQFSHEVTLEVLDNGIGLSLENKKGEGLVSMVERAKELGGTCTITSNPIEKQGTCVHVRIPLKGYEINGETSVAFNG